ncbi:MAG: preprotein translocase subunit YajC [Planctomycetota bacterium]
MIELLTILAQASQPAAPTTQSTGIESLFRGPLVPMLLMIVVFMWWMSRSRGKERKKFQQMLDSMKRNDRVQTIGGIIGTVVEVRDDEVIVKVDETNNTKMHFNRGSIKEVLRDSQNGG